MYCKEITEERVSELIAKRRAIEAAMEYWAENEKEYFVKIKVSYLPAVVDAKRTEEEVLVRREIISQYLQVECLQYWRYKKGSLCLNKYEYLDLWGFLKENEPKPKEGKMWGKLSNFFKKKKRK